MDAAQVIDLGREALWVAVMVASPLLGVALAVGLVVGIFQAATSIQEMTLSFIPKLGVMIIALMLFGSWQIGVMVDFFRRICDAALDGRKRLHAGGAAFLNNCIKQARSHWPSIGNHCLIANACHPLRSGTG